MLGSAALFEYTPAVPVTPVGFGGMLHTAPAPASDRAAQFADEANAWIDRGLALCDSDPFGAVMAFEQSAAFGSDMGMAYLGLSLIDAAADVDTPAAAGLRVAGLGWLETAELAGDPTAAHWMANHLASMPPQVVAAWSSLPRHAQTVLN